MECNICCSINAELYICLCNYNICLDCITKLHTLRNTDKCPKCNTMFDWHYMQHIFGSIKIKKYVHIVVENNIIKYTNKHKKYKKPDIEEYDICPRCNVPILKDDVMCNNVTCINCNLHFNWKNRKRVENNYKDSINIPDIISISNIIYTNREIRKYKSCIITLHETLLQFKKIYDILLQKKRQIKIMIVNDHTNYYFTLFKRYLKYILQLLYIIIQMYIDLVDNNFKDILPFLINVHNYSERVSHNILFVRLATQR